MEVWVTIVPDNDADELYTQGLLCVDLQSRARIHRFYQRPDAWRCLLGRLMARRLQYQLGSEIAFATTAAGKPYIVNNRAANPLAHNLAHDGDLVALALDNNAAAPAESALGVDIMKCVLPRGTTLRGFADILHDQLSESERKALRQPHPLSSQSFTDPTLLQHIFWIWTIKEAFTKCLGLGLGFDFSRISFDVKALPTDKSQPEATVHSDNDPVIILVDGLPLRGYEFTFFEVAVAKLGGHEMYQGVVARRMFPVMDGESNNEPTHNFNIHSANDTLDPSSFIVQSRIMFSAEDVGGSITKIDKTSEDPDNDWIKMWDAKSLVENAVPLGDSSATM